MQHRDPQTGFCTLPASQDEPAPGPRPPAPRPAVRYVGDPMGSWCWGIAPTLHDLAGYCQRHDLDFAITAGGLRPGGGDPWTAAFRDFLRREWEAIHQVTGQPFGYSLLDQASFDYDTEPACRAVVTLSHLLAPGAQHGSEILAFFSGIQRKFHVDGQVPKALDFYRGLCAPCGISGAAFRAAFLSPEMHAATRAAFAQGRRWGVRGFPTLLLDSNGRIHPLATGHIGGAALIVSLEKLLDAKAARPAADQSSLSTRGA